MQIVEDKAVVFKTRNPDKYSIIPKHKVIEQSDEGAKIAVLDSYQYDTLLDDECRVRDLKPIFTITLND